MSTMTKTSEHLLYLMACALQGVSAREEVLADADLKQLLIMARKHSVASMVCMALEKTAIFANADEATKKQWIDAKNKAIRKNMLLDAERKTILHELETQGIWYMPLKGSILKDWYPKPGMREMADNDILFDASKRKEVKAIFQGRGYTVKEYNKSNHDEYEKPPIYNFEMHVELYHKIYDTFNEKYADVKQRLIPDKMRKLQPDGGAITAHTKRKYLLSRIFPGREWCEAYAPTVYKYPVLLPFFWVWRLAVKGVKRRDIAKQELEAIKRKR